MVTLAGCNKAYPRWKFIAINESIKKDVRSQKKTT
jgi:hypothetical protein